MKHLCRDFQTIAGASCPGTNMYALSIFLLCCGGYSLTSQTNFDLFSSTLLKGNGNSGSINMAAGTYDVYIPSGNYSVSDDDIDRILALKSQRYPRANSGLFRITAVNSASNTVTVDYRSGYAPPPEQYLIWTIFENELDASTSWQSGSNGIPGVYNTWNMNAEVTASASRVILRSPHDSSWQLRMALESKPDIAGAVPSGFSIAPGYGGIGGGDFYPIPDNTGPGSGQKLHLHGAAWYNTTSSLYRGMTVGLTPALTGSSSGSLWAQGQWRISMIVDDVSGTCGIINQNVNLPVNATSGSGWAAFGLTEDESYVPSLNNLSDPTIGIARLFVAGSSNAQSNITWESQFHVNNNMQVVGWSKLGYPIPGVLSCYSDISNPGGHVRFLTSSVDTPWLGATELLDVDVVVGSVDQTLSAGSTTPITRLQMRRLGRLPMFRQGRANFDQWKVTGHVDGAQPDFGGTFYHTKNGVFMEWGGPPPTDGQDGSSSYFEISSSYGDFEGMRPGAANSPGSDPIPDTFPPYVQDIDAQRYKKTYSYFRQVPVVVGHIKGGSNPAKP